MASLAEDVLAMPAGADLDRAVDKIVFGKQPTIINGCPPLPASRQWSVDATAIHQLFDPLVESNDLCLGYDLFNGAGKFIVLTADGKLFASGPTSTVAMVRAILVHYGSQQHTPPPEPVQQQRQRRKGK